MNKKLPSVIRNLKFDIGYWKFSRGFTLIELLVAIAMLGILASGVLTLLDPIGKIQSANDARRKSDIAQIQRGLELYYDNFQRYPASSIDYRIQSGVTPINWGTSWTPYMASLPKDPNDNKTYVYSSGLNGISYSLFASLDRAAEDPQANCVVAGSCTIPAGATCGNACNYGVSSPNIRP